jgi:hypothetical protein
MDSVVQLQVMDNVLVSSFGRFVIITLLLLTVLC